MYHFRFFITFFVQKWKNIFKESCISVTLSFTINLNEKITVKKIQSSPVLIAVLLSEAGSVMSVCQTSGLCISIGITRGGLVLSQEVDASTLTGNDKKTNKQSDKRRQDNL